MKIIMLLLFSYTAQATTYYVSNAGSDAANGTSTGTSWQTAAKVNSFSFSAGDQILFKRGDTWNEKLDPPSSGNAVTGITFGYYGTGNKPVFTAFKTATMASIGGNLWTSTLTDGAKSQNTILVNGAIAGKGRYPNSTYLLTTAPSTTTVIQTGLTGTPNYSGGEIVIQPQTWITDVAKIASQSTGALTLSYPGATYSSTGNNRYFIQNLVSLCDVQNDWAYDSTTKLLTVYSVGLPVVQYSSIDTLVHVFKKDYVIFDGINFTGANNVSLYLDSSNYSTIQNCTFNYNGGNNFGASYVNGVGGAAIMGRTATYATISNDSILNSLNNGISLLYSSGNATISGNYIKNTSMLPGMGAGSEGAGIAISIIGHKPYVYNNRIDSVGYNGVHFIYSDTSLVYRNYVSNYCANKGDGAAFYTVLAGSEGSIIRSNIAQNGLSTGGNTAASYYLDGDSQYITIDSCTGDNGYAQAVLFHYPNHIEFHDNTIMTGRGACFWYAVGGSGNNFNITRNIFYQTDSLSATTNAIIYLYYGSLFTGSVSDSNYLLRPIKEDAAFRIGQTNTSYSLSGWHVTGYEINSSPTPSGITSAAGTLHINPTLSDSTITFSGLYIDAKGAQHNNSMVLHPYQSVILFKSATELPATHTGIRRLGTLIFN